MASEVFLGTFSLSRVQLQDFIRCILHTVLFQRSVGNFSPKEVRSASLGLVYVENGTQQLLSHVEECISHFISLFDKRENEEEGHIILSFYETTEKKGFFTTSMSKNYWEKWGFAVKVHDGKRILREEVCDIIERILNFCDQRKEYLPPIHHATEEFSCYPYNLSFPGLESSIIDVEFFKTLVK